MENKDKENKSVFVIIRELPTVKDRLWELAKKGGFTELSDFIRAEWRKW